MDADKNKILLLEDEEAHAFMIQRAFAKTAPQYSLILVSTLSAARQALAENTAFAAVIFDLNLPDGRGTDLLEEIGQWELPAIIMTSFGDETEAVKALKQGAMDYVAKSEYAFKEMPQIVNRAIREFRQIQENRRVNAELHKLHQAIEQSSTGIILTNGEGIIEYANIRMSEMSGYSNAELLGMQAGLLTTEDVVKHKQEDSDKLWNTVNSGNTWRGLFHCKRKNGTYYWDQSVISPIRDEKGNIVQFISYKEDVTASMQAQEELKKMEEQLRLSQKMQTIGTLAGGIAHDFNNILTPIFGFAHMILNGVEKDSQVHSDASHIIKAAERARDLVRQILAFARKGEQKREVLKLSAVVNDSVKMLQAMLPSSIKINAEVCDRCPPILGDATQLHQVIMNLGTNAYQAIGNKLGQINIGIEVEQVDAEFCRLHTQILTPGKYLVLTIADNGPGIPEDVIERIFEPFYTTKPVGEGTGLGLSVVHGIMASHKGDVVVQTSESGTKFRLYFPAQDSEVTATPPSDEIFKGHGEHIFVVDDEESNLKMQSRLLRYLGYQVTTFNNAVNALAEFKKDPQQVQLLITDQTMPAMTGVELASEVLALDAQFPIILLSGYIATEIETSAVNRTQIEFLHKPVDLPLLSATVHNMLAKRQAAEHS